PAAPCTLPLFPTRRSSDLTSRISFIVSTEGGMDIEKVAHDTPDKIVTLSIDPASGYSGFHGRKIASALKLEAGQIDQCVKLVGQDRKSTRLNSSHGSISYA